MNKSESIAKIAPALLKAQRKMGAATKGAANPYFKSKYADLGAVMEVVKDPLNDEGITILQPTYSKDGSHYVETILMHETGEFIASDALKLELNKTDMQQLGSAITYARRYTLQSLLSIPAEDDDGEASMGRMKPAPRELKEAAKQTLQPAKKVSGDPAVLKPENPQLVPYISGVTQQVNNAALLADSTSPTVDAATPEVPKSFTTFRKKKESEGLNF